MTKPVYCVQRLTYSKAQVLVVDSFDDLKAKASQAKGKIVLFNVPFVSYGTTVMYRVIGASEAAKVKFSEISRKK